MEPTFEAANKSYHEAQDRMQLLPNYYRWIAATFLRHMTGTVVELGVGAGLVLREYLHLVDRVYGVDHNDELLSVLAATFPGDRVVPSKVDLTGDWGPLAGVQADTVVALDVLEHFEADGEFLAKAARMLKPGGKVIVKVPAQPELFSAMDVASGHARRYSPESLRELSAAAGLSVLSLKYMNVFGSIAYRFKRKHKTNFSRSLPAYQLRVANTLIPALRLADILPLKGLSLVGVFEQK